MFKKSEKYYSLKLNKVINANFYGETGASFEVSRNYPSLRENLSFSVFNIFIV